MAILGTRNLLNVSREAEAGMYLDAGPLGEILLPRRYVVPGWNFKVCVCEKDPQERPRHHDSERRETKRHHTTK